MLIIEHVYPDIETIPSMKQTDQFDANTLLMLAKVIELKSVSGAASVLGIPRSTVSRKINKLETELGIKLLRKNTRQITVTDLGHEIYKHALVVQNEINMVRALLGGRRVEPQGALRVAMPVFMGVDFASKVGASFLQKYPKARLEMRFVDSVVHPIKDGFDVTLAYGPLQDSTLIGKKLFDVERLLCASPKFIKKLARQIDRPSQLDEQPFVEVGQDSDVFKLQLRNGKKHYEFAPDVRAQANNYQVGKHYVLQGMGIGALPKHVCLHELIDGKLVSILENWLLETREVYVLYPFQLTYSSLIKAFYETAYETMEEFTENSRVLEVTKSKTSKRYDADLAKSFSGKISKR